MRPFDIIAFDLDDTLFDTSAFLVPRAARESCEAMIKAGLPTDLEACLQLRRAFLQKNPRGDVYSHLTEHFGVTKNVTSNCTINADGNIATIGYDAFYSRQVESDIALAPSVWEMLKSLQSGYKIFLVTAGHVETQSQKVKILKIAPFFEKIFYIDSFKKSETKKEAFAEILDSRRNLAPKASRCLSVGNRLDTDIAPAKALGWHTCWVKYGEYVQMQPKGPTERPDFTVDRIEELTQICHL